MMFRFDDFPGLSGSASSGSKGMNRRDLVVETVGSDSSGLSGSSGPGSMASHSNIGMKQEIGKSAEAVEVSEL